jgi:hypothetical protein
MCLMVGLLCLPGVQSTAVISNHVPWDGSAQGSKASKNSLFCFFGFNGEGITVAKEISSFPRIKSRGRCKTPDVLIFFLQQSATDVRISQRSSNILSGLDETRTVPAPQAANFERSSYYAQYSVKFRHWRVFPIPSFRIYTDCHEIFFSSNEFSRSNHSSKQTATFQVRESKQ